MVKLKNFKNQREHAEDAGIAAAPIPQHGAIQEGTVMESDTHSDVILRRLTLVCIAITAGISGTGKEGIK